MSPAKIGLCFEVIKIRTYSRKTNKLQNIYTIKLLKVVFIIQVYTIIIENSYSGKLKEESAIHN